VTFAGRGRRAISVISSPDLGVSAVAAAGVCVHLPAWWTRYLNTVSAEGLVRITLSLLFLELMATTLTLFGYMSSPQTSWSGAA
jgi:hypothetical protein